MGYTLCYIIIHLCQHKLDINGLLISYFSDTCAKLMLFAALKIVAASQDSVADVGAFVVVPVAVLRPPAPNEAMPFLIAVLRPAIAGWSMSRFLSFLSRVTRH